MTNLPAHRVLDSELVSPEDRINVFFDRYDVEGVLRRFASGEPVDIGLSGRTTEGDVDQVLTGYTTEVSRISFLDDTIDVGLVRTGFDRVQDCMNEVANEKHGGKRPRSMAQVLLIRAGVRSPVAKIYFSKLDDKYWESQFIEQYTNEVWVKRRPGQSESSYFNQYTASVMRSFVLAPYSYI